MHASSTAFPNSVSKEKTSAEKIMLKLGDVHHLLNSMKFLQDILLLLHKFFAFLAFRASAIWYLLKNSSPMMHLAKFGNQYLIPNVFFHHKAYS
jgi:hypothetical protein